MRESELRRELLEILKGVDNYDPHGKHPDSAERGVDEVMLLIRPLLSTHKEGGEV